MLNFITLVGRIVNKPELVQDEDKKYLKITIACPRSFKNSDGIYETDFIPVILWNGIAERTAEYCNKGDLIGIKGRIEVQNEQIIIIGERVSFFIKYKK